MPHHSTSVVSLGWLPGRHSWGTPIFYSPTAFWNTPLSSFLFGPQSSLREEGRQVESKGGWARRGCVREDREMGEMQVQMMELELEREVEELLRIGGEGEVASMDMGEAATLGLRSDFQDLVDRLDPVNTTAPLFPHSF
ncbi:hypothetical protein BDM02DRAFT_3192893 [Thelephora ganbajun]|uniref:Uncharacterized protein n=1 Tax=Thelephora ganbajun TaxID=370292 RepID=A0ACB6YYU4_THEGA|nr:hypothetical protein BDM02DRAFT_3192893 [Thelephora ganbajun]